MDIIYNEAELKEFSLVSEVLNRILLINVFSCLILSIPLIVGILLITIWKLIVYGIICSAIGIIILIPILFSTFYSIKIYLKSKKKDFLVKREKVLKIEGDGIDICKIGVNAFKKNILFINIKDNLPLSINDEVDIICNKHGKPMFAILPIDMI